MVDHNEGDFDKEAGDIIYSQRMGCLGGTWLRWSRGRGHWR